MNGNIPDEEIGHGVLLSVGPHRGKVLMWGYEIQQAITRSYVWDPASPSARSLIHNGVSGHNFFCAGVTAHGDGTLVLGGGVGFAPSGSTNLYALFDPNAIDHPVLGPFGGTPWSVPSDTMLAPSFYPTLITLTKDFSGDAFMLGGTNPQIAFCPQYPSTAPPLPPNPDPCANPQNVYGIVEWQRRGAAPLSQWQSVSGFVTLQRQFFWYPQMFQLSTGDILIPGDTYADGWAFGAQNNPPGATWLLTSLTPQPASGGGSAVMLGSDALPTPQVAASGVDRHYGSAILRHDLLQKDRVLVFGGGAGYSDTQLNSSTPAFVQSSVQEYELSMDTWHTKTSMVSPRVHSNAVILPTGEVFLVGGDAVDIYNNKVLGNTPEFSAEIYDPHAVPSSPGSTAPVATPNVAPGSTYPTPRSYHQVALLLPDARVFLFGGENIPSFAESAHSGEIYSPPYLFQGPRPTITCDATATLSAPGAASTFNALVTTPGNGAVVDRVVAMKPGCCTHHFDNQQRYIELDYALTQVGAREYSLVVTAPLQSLGPQGAYMVFVVSKNHSSPDRIPSPAAWIDFQ